MQVHVQAVAARAKREPPVRYTVLEVHDSRLEKVLRALDERTGRELAVRTTQPSQRAR